MIRLALRSLKRTPVFTAAVILTLALGIAAVGSMFAIVYGVLLAPLPYGQPDRLVSVSLQTAGLDRIGQPPAAYFTYQRYAHTLDAIGFYRTGNTNVWTEGDGKPAESLIATWVTASMLPLLQASPVLGRSFTAEEERRGGPDAVMLSESEWRMRFGAAPDVIGRTLMVNSVARQIVGVMPASFAFPNADTRVWLPVKHTDSTTVAEFIYSAVARLAPGATAAQAQSELAAVLPMMADTFPRLESGSSTATWLADMRPTPVVLPLRDQLTAPIARTLWLLAAAAGLVLLVAWANVANLLLIRADGRQPELAVREALGASRLRIAAQFLGEALVLGSTAGALALPGVLGTVHALVAFGPANVPRLAELGVGPMTMGFLLLVTAAGVMICTAVPAVRIWRTRRASNLHAAGRGNSAGKASQRIRAAIAILQIAVALVVALGSALLLRTAYRLSEVHPGFDATSVTTFRTQLPFARYDEAAAVAFYARLAAAAGQVPSVRSAGLTANVPLGRGQPPEQVFRVEGAARTVSLPVNVVDDGYFATMRIALRAGRGFGRTELQRDDDILITQRAAAALFGDPDAATAVGKRVSLAPAGPTYTVSGVVGDVRDRDLATAPVAMAYRPHVVSTAPGSEPMAPRNMVLVVRTGGPAGAVVPAIRRLVHELDPTIPIFSIETMSEVVRTSTARLSLMLTLMTAAAAITLLLSMIGLYGLMAYMVALHCREFGVRIALGAAPRQIVRLVAARGLLLTVCGVSFGLVLYAAVAPFIRAFLYGVTASDPLTLLGATLLLVATAVLASWLPAQRAARVDPAQALQAQ